MPQITCNVKSCSNNKNGGCVLEYIGVDGTYATNCDSTCCSSYTKEDAKSYSAYGGVDCRCDPCICSEIDCAAGDCIFNEDGECRADSIEIDGKSARSASQTRCDSFTYAD